MTPMLPPLRSDGQREKPLICCANSISVTLVLPPNWEDPYLFCASEVEFPIVFDARKRRRKPSFRQLNFPSPDHLSPTTSDPPFLSLCLCSACILLFYSAAASALFVRHYSCPPHACGPHPPRLAPVALTHVQISCYSYVHFRGGNCAFRR